MRRRHASGPWTLGAAVAGLLVLGAAGGAAADDGDAQRHWIAACQQALLSRYEADGMPISVHHVEAGADGGLVVLDTGPPHDEDRYRITCSYRAGALVSFGYALPEPPRRPAPSTAAADGAPHRGANTPTPAAALDAEQRPWADACRRDALARYDTSGLTIQVTGVTLTPDTNTVLLELGPADDPARYRTGCSFEEPFHTRPDAIVYHGAEPPRRPGMALDAEQRRFLDACQLAVLARYDVANYESQLFKMLIRPERTFVAIETGPPANPLRHKVTCSFRPTTGMKPQMGWVLPEPPRRAAPAPTEPAAGPRATPQGSGGR